MSRKVSERALSPKGLVSLLAWIAIVLATVALTVGILRPSRVERCPSSTRGRDSPTGSGSERSGSR
jgi:hypothetical protein